jgi:ribosomal protein S18 acetylase RimI-like enzyme
MGEIKGLYRLKKNDISRAAPVIADAFQHDPIWNELIGEGVNMSQKFLLIAHFFLKYCFTYGEIYATSDKMEGIMAFLRNENAYMTGWGMIRSGAVVPFLRLGLKGIAKMTFSFEPLDEVRRKVMESKPFIYLQVIGVASEFQGKGYGGKMLRELISLSEQENIPIYLDTETESNVRLYERFNFRMHTQMALPGMKQPMWAMIRENPEQVGSDSR